MCFVVTAWTNLNWRNPSLNVRQWQSSSKSRQNGSPQTPAKRVSVCQTIRRHPTNERVARGATRVSAKPYHRDVGNGSPCLCYPPNVCPGIWAPLSFPLTSARCRLAKRRQVATGSQPVDQLQTHRRAALPFVDIAKQRRRHHLRMATGRRRAEAFTACFHSKENVGATH